MLVTFQLSGEVQHKVQTFQGRRPDRRSHRADFNKIWFSNKLSQDVRAKAGVDGCTRGEIATTLGGFMKRIANILTVLSLAVLSAAGLAQAQSDGQRMTANIPFDFTAGNLTFSAGQYDFLRSPDGLYLIRDANGHAQMILAGAAVQQFGPPEKSNLKFELVNGRHVLIQVWSEVAALGNDFPNGSPSVGLEKRTADVTIPTSR